MKRKNVMRGLALASTLCGLIGGWFLVRGGGGVQDQSLSTRDVVVPNVAGLDKRARGEQVLGDAPIAAGVAERSDVRSEAAASIRQGPGFVPQETTEPSSIRAAATTFRRGQNNAFFDEAAYARTFAANGGQGIDHLRKELQSVEALMALPEGVNYFQDAPEEVLDRMAMIDMLGVLAKDEDKALDALVEIATQPLDASLPPHVVRALVGEKYDAFVELARHDWKVASSAFSALNNDKLQEAMRPALLSGLVDSGTPNEEALRMVQAI